jgi:hypothetical protein
LLIDVIDKYNFMARTNKWGVVLPQGTITKENSKDYRRRGGWTATIRATRSDKGKKRK